MTNLERGLSAAAVLGTSRLYGKLVFRLEFGGNLTSYVSFEQKFQ